jgi:4-carboxymuconolactone decarboxylase
MARLASVVDADMTDAQRALAQLIAGGPRGSLRGPFIPLLHNPELAGHIQKIGEYLRFGGTFPKHLTELAILVVSFACKSPYEWAAHAPLGRKEGLAEAVVEAVGQGSRPDSDNAGVLAVYDFVAMLLDRKTVSDTVYGPVHALFGEAGALELIGLCGYYTILALVLNIADMPLPEGGSAPFRTPTA